MSVYRRGQRALKNATPDQAKRIEKGLKSRPWTVEVELGKIRYTLSSETRVRSDALSMELMLKALYATGAEEPLRYLRTGQLSLREIYLGYKKGTGLEPLLSRVRAQAEEATRPRLGVLVKAWFAWLESSPVSARSKRELAASTAERYRSSMKKLLEFIGRTHLEGPDAVLGPHTKEAIAEAWPPLSPDVFTTALLDAYRVTRKAQGRSAGTINRDLNTVLAFYTWLESRDEPFPMKRPKFVREAELNERDRCLEPEEWEQVRQAFSALNDGTTQFLGRRSGGTSAQGVVPTGALWVLFETLVLTGLRLGEALALKWGDLNHKQHVIKVSRSLEKNGKVTGLPSASAAAKRPRAERLKSLGSQRNVPLVVDLAARLIAHRNIFEAFGSGHHDRIFPPAVFNMRRMQDLWSRAVAATGIPHATVHDLRHTFAIHALDGGTRINDLKAILGHSNLTMVMRYLRRRSNTNTAQSGEAVAALMLQARVPSSGV
jgi:integrase